MKTMIAAIALTIAIPAAAHAQAPADTPAHAEKHGNKHEDGKECCCKGKKMACCDKMDGQNEKAGAADPHAGHDMSGHQQPQH